MTHHKILCILTFLIAVIPSVTGSFLAARFDTGVTNALLDNIRTELLPSVVAYLNANPYEDSGSEKIADNFLFSSTAHWSVATANYVLGPNLDLAVISESRDNGAIAFRFVLTNASLKFDVDASVRAKNVGSCSPKFSVTAEMDEIDILVEAYTDDEGNMLRYKLFAIQISTPDIDLDRRGSNLCSKLISVLDGPLDLIVDLFLNGNKIEEAINEAVGPVVAELRTKIPEYAGYEFERSDEVIGEITYSGGIDQLYSTTEGVYVDFESTFGARLLQPEHRVGMSYTSSESPKSLPSPNENSLVNFHVSMDGINNILESVWYLVWSTVAKDPEAYESTLCQPVDSDACPFPPFIQQVSGWNHFLLGLTFFTNFEIYTSFSVEAVVPSPALDVRDGVFNGSVMAGFVVKGKRLFRDDEKILANLEGEISVDATTPVYNDRTGILSGLVITDIEINDVESDISGNLFLSWKTDLVANIITSFVNDVLDSLLDLVNKGIDRAIQGIPLKIPSLENFPNPGQVTNFYLSDASVEAIGSTDEAKGYVDLDTNFTIEVV